MADRNLPVESEASPRRRLLVCSWTKRWSWLPGRSRGQGLVEFALILPAFLLLIMGIIEFGYVLTVYTGLFNAAREGARVGVVNPRSMDQIIATARQKIFIANPNGPTVNV